MFWDGVRWVKGIGIGIGLGRENSGIAGSYIPLTVLPHIQYTYTYIQWNIFNVIGLDPFLLGWEAHC